MNNEPFDILTGELREGDPLCRYVTVQRNHIEVLLALSAERTSQLAVACELLQRTRAELLRVWRTDQNNLQAYQQAALHSIDECLAGSDAALRLYRHSVRRQFASSLTNLLDSHPINLERKCQRRAGTRQSRRSRKPSKVWGGGLTIVRGCLDGLLSRLLIREEITDQIKKHTAEPRL